MTSAAVDSSARERYLTALRELWDVSAYDRGFITNPFAGDDVAALGLRRTRAMLDLIGQPDLRMPILHVAGSKGKGSTCAFASSILTAAGMRTGTYTSPHLHAFRERFAIDCESVSEGTFVEFWNRVRDVGRTMEQVHPEFGAPTAFELTTAMAFDLFAVSSCTAAVIEVGLGGTLDATNVIHPVSTVIAALDYEHTRVLGTTLAEIAANKAGIIKTGVPLATAVMAPEAHAVVAAKVDELAVQWLRAGRDWTWEGDWRTFTLHGPWGTFSNLSSALVGGHQVDNASLAVAGMWHMLGDRLTEDVVRDGLARTRWPGRFEIVQHERQTVVLDGAHTPAAATALARAFAAEFPDQRAVLILGLLNDKDPLAIAHALKPVTGRIIAVTPPTPRGLPAAELAERLNSAGFAVDTAATMSEALESAGDGLGLVTGSLSTVAWARESLGLAIPDPPISS